MEPGGGEEGGKTLDELEFPNEWVRANEFMQNQQYEKAIPLLNSLQSAEEIPAKMQHVVARTALIEALWNLGMTTMKNNNPTACKEALLRLSKPPLAGSLPPNIPLATVHMLLERANTMEEQNRGVRGQSETGNRLRAKLEAKKRKQEEDALLAALGKTALVETRGEAQEEEEAQEDDGAKGQRGPRRSNKKKGGGKKKK